MTCCVLLRFSEGSPNGDHAILSSTPAEAHLIGQLPTSLSPSVVTFDNQAKQV